jgi:hypothetical protein
VSQQKSRKPSQSQQVRLKTLTAFVSRSWKIIVGASSVVGLIGGLMYFAARVTVSSLTPLNPTDPFSTPFSISNDGAFSIYDVEFSCSLNDVKFPNGGGMSNLSVGGYGLPPIKVIEAGEKATYQCLIGSQETPKGSQADIHVVVSYQPKFIPCRIDKPYRFVMKQGSDKQWYWFQQPVSESFNAEQKNYLICNFNG